MLAATSVVKENLRVKGEEKLRSRGLKSLVGNAGYRRYLKVEGSAAGIDQGAIQKEALYDGKYVLCTNTDLTPEEAVLAYKELWQVERAFRNLKSGLDLRPIHHWTDRRVRGHIMVCFLRRRIVVEGVFADLEDLGGRRVAGSACAGSSAKATWWRASLDSLRQNPTH